MQASFYDAAALKFGFDRQTGHRTDGKFGLMVLEIKGVESKETCKNVIGVDHQFHEMAIALYRASYYDAVKEAEGTFTAEDSHVKYVTDKLRQTHQTTPIHWRLGVDAKLSLEVFDSAAARIARTNAIYRSSCGMNSFFLFSESPPLLMSFNQEHLSFSRRQSTFVESYLRDGCLTSMSADQIIELKGPAVMRMSGIVGIVAHQLEMTGGDVAYARYVYYNKRCPYFSGELAFEATLLGALAQFLPSVSSSPLAFVPGPMSFTVPLPYGLLERKGPCNFAQLVNRCSKELANQDGNHIAAMAAIFNQRSLVMSRELDMVHLGRKPLHHPDDDDELARLKASLRVEIDRCKWNIAKVTEAMNDSFLVALLGAMEVAVTTFERVSSGEEEPQMAAATAAVGEKRKAQDPSVVESSSKQAKL